MFNESILNVEIINKNFVSLDTLFKEYGWHLIKNKIDDICYTKIGNETDIFDIKINDEKIYINIPLKNSCYNYKTTFTNYFIAGKYIEKKLLEFVKN